MFFKGLGNIGLNGGHGLLELSKKFEMLLHALLTLIAFIEEHVLQVLNICLILVPRVTTPGIPSVELLAAITIIERLSIPSKETHNIHLLLHRAYPHIMVAKLALEVHDSFSSFTLLLLHLILQSSYIIHHSCLLG